jgi:hypothetical protein
MTWSRIAVVLALASSAAHAQGPSSTPPAPAAPTTSPPPPDVAAPVPMMSSDEVAHFLSFFDSLVDTVVHDAQSCDQMALDVSALIDANQANLAIARAARAAHKRMPNAAQYHMLDGVRRMSPGLDNCSDHAKVKAAFAKLDDDHGSR